MSLAPASRPEELDPAWLTAALGRPVTAVSCDRVGTGQIGECYRLRLTGDGVPASVLAKLPAAESSARELLAGAYRSEHRFYTQLAATVDVRVPDCHFAVIDPATGEFTLLLEDLATYQQGDQLGGCTVDQARDAVENLAGLHGPRWCDPTLLDVDGLSLNGPADASLLQELYVPATETFLEALGDRVPGEDAETLRACALVSEAWALGRAERYALCHGDYRLDNVMFPSIGTGSVALDWQTLSLALPARDLAFFLGTSLAVETRRAARAGPRRRLPLGAAFARSDDVRRGALLGGLPLRDAAGTTDRGVRLRLRHQDRARRRDVRGHGVQVLRRDPRPGHPGLV